MIKKISKSGFSIHAYTAILEKISFFLITLFLIKKLNVEDLAVFTQLFIYSGILTLFVDMGSGMLFVNYHKKYSAHIVLHLRFILYFTALIPILLIFDDLLVVFFLMIFTLDSLSKFPQYFQIRQRGLKVFYSSQFIKGSLLIGLSFFWATKDSITLDDVLLSLSFIYFATSLYIILPFVRQIFIKLSYNLAEYKALLIDGKSIFLSQLLFMVKLSLPLYITTIYFQDQLKEFRIYIMVFSIVQQFMFVGFSAIYPKLVESHKFIINIKWMLIAIFLFAVLNFVAYNMKDDIWPYMFLEVAMTEYQNIVFFTISIALPITLVYLYKVTIENAKKNFHIVFKANLVAALATIVFVSLAIYLNEFLWLLMAFVIYDLMAIFVLFLKKERASVR